MGLMARGLPGDNLGRYNRLSQMLMQPAGLYANNGTIAGGLAAALQQGLQGFIAGREQRNADRRLEQYDQASQAFLGSQSADEAFANLSALQDNPYAGQFLMQMAPDVWDRREADERRQTLMASLFGGGQPQPAGPAPAMVPSAPGGASGSYIDAVAGHESGGSPTIRNARAQELGLPVSQQAAGLYQFMPSTWAPYAQRMGFPSDPAAATPEQQRAVMEAFTAENEAMFQQSLGREPNDAERYLMHFQGPAGAIAILQAPSGTPLFDVLTQVRNVGYANEVFRQNPNLSPDITTDQLIRMMYQRFPQQVSPPPGGVASAQPAASPAQSGGLSPRTMAMLMSGDPVFEALGAELAAQELSGPQRQDLPTGMIYGPDGRPVWVENYLEGREQIAQAGRPEFRIGDDAPPALAEVDQGAIETMTEAYGSLNSMLPLLDRLEDALDAFDTGPGGGVRLALNQIAASLGDEGAAQRASAGEVIRSIQNQLAPRMRVPGSGATSDMEVNMFLNSLPNLSTTPEGNRLIIDGFRRIAERRRQELRIARRYMARDGYMTDAYFDEVEALGPIFDDRQRGVMAGQPAASSGAAQAAEPSRYLELD